MRQPSIHRLPWCRAVAVLTAFLGCAAHADAPVAPGPAEASGLSGGARIFSHTCQGCHMPDAHGAVGAGHYPQLAGDPALASWQYAATTVLNGRKGMPPFGRPGARYSGFLNFVMVYLTDAEVADVVNYVRSNFGNHFKETVTAAQVSALAHPGAPAAH
jgi:mono/diheme cytochrome c family protein